MNVVPVDLANDPITRLYGAYRACDSPKTPREPSSQSPLPSPTFKA